MLLPLSTEGLEEYMPSEEEWDALEDGAEIDVDAMAKAMETARREQEADRRPRDKEGNIISPARSLEAVCIPQDRCLQHAAHTADNEAQATCTQEGCHQARRVLLAAATTALSHNGIPVAGRRSFVLTAAMQEWLISVLTLKFTSVPSDAVTVVTI